MSDIGSLDQALSKLTEAADLADIDENVDEVARVRKARAGVTEHARQNGDTAGTLLSGLINESNNEYEKERAERERLLQEAEEKKRREQQEAEEKKRREAQAVLEEEKRRLEEKEQRRLKMLADLEKKRKREAGEVDEEEEARKREEAEAEAKRIAAEKEREAAKEAQLKSSNEELAEKIRLMKEQKASAEAAEAAKKAKNQRLTVSIAALAGILAVSALTVYFVTLKAPNFYILSAEAQLASRSLTPADNSKNLTAQSVAYSLVTQEAPKVKTATRTGQSKKKDNGLAIVDLSGKGKITF